MSGAKSSHQAQLDQLKRSNESSKKNFEINFSRKFVFIKFILAIEQKNNELLSQKEIVRNQTLELEEYKKKQNDLKTQLSILNSSNETSKLTL